MWWHATLALLLLLTQLAGVHHAQQHVREGALDPATALSVAAAPDESKRSAPLGSHLAQLCKLCAAFGLADAALPSVARPVERVARVDAAPATRSEVAVATRPIWPYRSRGPPMLSA